MSPKNGEPACNCCGLCCRFPKVPGVVVTIIDIVRAIDFLGQHPADFGRLRPQEYYVKYFSRERFPFTVEFCGKRKEDHSCIFLNEDFKCSIYPARPWMCVLYEYSSWNLSLPLEGIRLSAPYCYTAAWVRKPTLTAEQVIWNVKTAMCKFINESYVQVIGGRFDYDTAKRYATDPKLWRAAQSGALSTTPPQYLKLYRRRLEKCLNPLEL